MLYLGRKFYLEGKEEKDVLSSWTVCSALKPKVSCHKKYPAYQSVMEKRKGTVYASKLGGIPYIPEGEKWVVCSKCNVEKVLILQLNIQELPEVSNELREWDFIQIFACMKPILFMISWR